MSFEDNVARPGSKSANATGASGSEVLSGRGVVGLTRPLPDSPEDPYQLRRWWHDVMSHHGQYSCYAILLVLPADKEALRYLADYGKELDYISHEECLVVVLTKTQFRRSGIEDEVWGKVVTEHSAEGLSVEVARLFGVRYDGLPCLLVFEDIRSSRHVVISLKGMSAEEMAQRLRSVFSTIRDATSKEKDTLTVLERQSTTERHKKTGRQIMSELRSLTGKTFETAMKSWIKAAVQ